MKRISLIGALSLALVACGTNQPQPVDEQPVVDQPTDSGVYNPAPSTTESNDQKVPYIGDWAWVAKRSDGSSQRGVLSVKERGTPTEQAKNGGLGPAVFCQDDACVVKYEPTYGVINTYIVNGQAQLAAVIGDPAITTPRTNRLGMVDTDAQVTLNAQKNAVIAGAGTWVPVTGQPGETVQVAFVQMDAKPDDGQFGVPLADAFAQAREAANAVVIPQGLNTSSLLHLPLMVPLRK